MPDNDNVTPDEIAAIRARYNERLLHYMPIRSGKHFMSQMGKDIQVLLTANDRLIREVERLTARVDELEQAVVDLNAFDAPAELVKERMKVAELEAENARLKKQALACGNGNHEYADDGEAVICKHCGHVPFMTFSKAELERRAAADAHRAQPGRGEGE